jgi:hypothetical protein
MQSSGSKGPRTDQGSVRVAPGDESPDDAHGELGIAD